MSINQYRLMLLPLLATLIMAGFVTTVGLLTAPAAETYGVEITSISAQFTWLTGGIFLGGVVAFFIFDYLSIKSVIVWMYGLSAILIGVLHLSGVYSLLPWLFFVIGLLLAVVTCGAVTVITQQWMGKQRQMIMVGQDAMFNGGGIIFSFAATWFVVRELPWTSVYVVVAGLIAFVVLLSVVSDFKPQVTLDDDDEPTGVGGWNTGIILVGISLALFMLAKISIFVWAPQYLEQNFGATVEASGTFMGNIFTAAFIGSLFGTWAASRVDVKYLLFCFVFISTASVFAFTQTDSVDVMLLLAYCYGVSVSATYNSYVAFGLSFIVSPNHKNVVYLQLMSGLGSTLAPFASSMIVERGGDIETAIQFCFVTLVLVAISLGIAAILHRKETAGAPAPAA